MSLERKKKRKKRRKERKKSENRGTHFCSSQGVNLFPSKRNKCTFICNVAHYKGNRITLKKSRIKKKKKKTHNSNNITDFLLAGWDIFC